VVVSCKVPGYQQRGEKVTSTTHQGVDMGAGFCRELKLGRLRVWLGAVCLACLFWAFPAAAQTQAGNRPPRALLLQQAPSQGPNVTLLTLERTGFAATWINQDGIADLPEDVTGLQQRFDLVFFGSLAREGGIDKLCSKAQLEALRQFVQQGGGLVTVIGEAGKVFAELLPLTPGKSAGPTTAQPTVAMPEHPALLGLPEEWPTFGSKWNSFNKATAKPGAVVLM